MYSTRRSIAAMLSAVMFVLLLALSGAASVGAAQPSGPPGQGDCDHGNSQRSCRPDPQPSNGQDCENHGNNGGVNEDHCASTPPEVTPSPTSEPSTAPSDAPSAAPSDVPPSPSVEPSVSPSSVPSIEPSSTPATPVPSVEPTSPVVTPTPAEPTPASKSTPPPTDTSPTSSVAGGANLYLVLAGLFASLTVALGLTPRRMPRR